MCNYENRDEKVIISCVYHRSNHVLRNLPELLIQFVYMTAPFNSTDWLSSIRGLRFYQDYQQASIMDLTTALGWLGMLSRHTSANEVRITTVSHAVKVYGENRANVPKPSQP